jgi:hypothetical protein
MGLDAIVRRAVAKANTITASLQVEVTHEARTGQDTYGAPTFAAAVARPAIVERKQKLIRDTNGQERLSQHKVTFLQPVTLDVRDRITLPDGTTGPILDIAGLVDAGTNAPYYAEVLLGDGSRQ